MWLHQFAPAVEVVATPQTLVAPVGEAPATPAVAAEPVAAPAQAAEGDVVGKSIGWCLLVASLTTSLCICRDKVTMLNTLLDYRSHESDE